MRGRLAVLALVVSALALSGCSAVEDLAATAEPTDSASQSPTADVTEVTTEPTPEPTPTSTPEPTPEPEPAEAAEPEPAVQQVAEEPEPEPEPELVAGPPIWGVGSSGEEVRKLQARLAQIGWFNRDLTDYYGDVTAEAVSGFQAKRGIPVVGFVDQRTWDRLVGMTFEPTQDELYPPPPEPEPEPEEAAVVEVAPGIDKRCLTGRVICIDKSQSLVRWVIGGNVQMTLDARFGSELTPTREGVFSVQRKVEDEYSRLYDDAPMPFAVYFSGGQAVHYSPDFVAWGYNGSSHGCVNTRSWDGMQALFNSAQIGDKVVVYWS